MQQGRNILCGWIRLQSIERIDGGRQRRLGLALIDDGLSVVGDLGIEPPFRGDKDERFDSCRSESGVVQSGRACCRMGEQPHPFTAEGDPQILDVGREMIEPVAVVRFRRS